jgi:hypothetical protein
MTEILRDAMPVSSRFRCIDIPRHLTAVVLAAALMVPAITFAQAPPKSLGEIARAEAERRKALTAPAKVYTKDDLPKSARVPATAPGAAPASKPADQQPATPVAGEAEKDGKTEKPERDEEWWRGRLAQVREAIRRNQMFAQALQTRINSLAADFTSRDDPLQRAQIADDRNKALAELEMLATEAKTLQQQIADIEAEAHRAGVPPGWLR